ncbi:DUF3300 domain-containing protein [Litorilituus lipolyticus]|uniref:DUF3300 domain-containing protein n=1 Tax=Litorilituus lipolyticus TaxID=2491017 RepID=A0A502KWG4_9GAMM|nr:DUF3300 domain-containing protein [Litorilituus lipolyticus]TPH15846.1 DUF3300 domain-containing protein [Litorilituus lipolyticus]
MNKFTCLITSVILLTQSIGFAKGIVSENLRYDASPYHEGENYYGDEIEQGELAQLLAPIALYPDTLLTHILIASTYPLEVVHANRWLSNHSEYSQKKISNKLKNKEWDESVKVLVSFPSVLKRLNDDLTWTQKIGDAFLLDEARVLDSIQQLRRQARASGSLDNMSNMTVSYDQNNIVIEPVEQKVIYVPYYDTRIVYGHWGWAHYPPIYWHIPSHIYVRHYSYSRYRPFYWHKAVHISAHFYFGAFHWHKKHVVITPYPKRIHYPDYSRVKVVKSSGSKRWHHKPSHRRGVKYAHSSVKHKYHPRSRITKVRPHHGHIKAKLNKPHKGLNKTVHNTKKENLANKKKVKYSRAHKQHTKKQVKYITQKKEMVAQNKQKKTKQFQQRTIHKPNHTASKPIHNKVKHKTYTAYNKTKTRSKTREK